MAKTNFIKNTKLKRKARSIKLLIWKAISLRKQNKKLRKFKNIHNGKDILIMGAGSSLDTIPHEFLQNFIVIGTNKSYIYYKPDYWVVTDAQFSWMEDGRTFCHKNNIPAFINWIWSPKKPDILYPKEISLHHHKISLEQGPTNIKLKESLLKLYTSPAEIEKTGISSTSSVVSECAIPLALYMGCRNIYLAGVDFYTPDINSSYSMKRSKADQKKIEKLTKKIQRENNSKKDMWEYKRWTIELIAETDLKDRVFNLSEKSSVKNIAKINYQDVKTDIPSKKNAN